MMQVHLVRHTKPTCNWSDDYNRFFSKTEFAIQQLVIDALARCCIHHVTKRSYRQTIEAMRSCTKFFDLFIHINQRLRKCESKIDGYSKAMYEHRWNNCTITKYCGTLAIAGIKNK